MKLKKCHVISFGTLRDFDYDFGEKLNVVMRENGEGKSTFAAFLKAMLYGLPGGQKKKIEENDRKKYAPWQTGGGSFGGWLEFSSDRGDFRITRTFGDKESEDQTELLDLGTNLKIEKDGENADLFEPGLSILGLDSESFERTLFFSERDMKVANSDSVTSRLSALTSGDDASFEEAMKLLEKRRTYYSGKNGEIERLSAKERELDRDRAEAENAQRLAISARSDCDAAEKELVDTKNEEFRLASELKTLRAYGQKKEILSTGKSASDRRQSEISNREKCLTELDRCRTRLSGASVSNDELQGLSDCVRDFHRLYDAQIASENDAAGDPDSAIFAIFAQKGVPSDDEINARIGERSRADALVSQANEKKNVFADSSSEGRARARHTPRERAGIAVRFFVCLALLGLALVIAGTILNFAMPARKTAAIILIAAGVPALLIGVVGAIFSEKSAKKYALHEEEREKKIAELEKEALECRGSCEKFAEEYGVKPDKIETLFSLKARYAAKCAKEKENAENAEKTAEIAGKLRISLGKYLEDPENAASPAAFEKALADASDDLKKEKDLSDEIERLGDRITLYDRDVEDALQKLFPDGAVPAGFEFASALSEIEELTDPERENDLSAKLASVRRTIDLLNGRIGSLKERIGALDACADRLPQLENDYSFYKEKRENAENSLDLIKKTKDFLEKAKNQLSGAYLGGMQTKFKEIFEKVIGTEDENVRIDAKFGLRLERGGQGREAANFSRGYQCVMGFAMRLALVRTIFEDREAPIFMLDDPFAGLDDRRFAAMKEVVNDLSEEYQILYFTCTSQRDLQ